MKERGSWFIQLLPAVCGFLLLYPVEGLKPELTGIWNLKKSSFLSTLINIQPCVLLIVKRRRTTYSNYIFMFYLFLELHKNKTLIRTFCYKEKKQQSKGFLRMKTNQKSKSINPSKFNNKTCFSMPSAVAHRVFLISCPYQQGNLNGVIVLEINVRYHVKM